MRQTLSQVIEQGGISGVNHETGMKDQSSSLDQVAITASKAFLSVINLVKDFSPISFLSTGRSVTPGMVAQAFVQIVMVMGGLFAALGIWAFYKVELAAAQNNQ